MARTTTRYYIKVKIDEHRWGWLSDQEWVRLFAQCLGVSERWYRKSYLPGDLRNMRLLGHVLEVISSDTQRSVKR